MKIKLLIICLLVAFTARAQTVTPNPGPYQNISTKYQYTWQKWTGGIWNLGKLVQTDSAMFAGITYVPNAPENDSSTQAANTGWIKRNIAPGIPGQPVLTWAYRGNYTDAEPTQGRLGFLDSADLHLITNNGIRLTIPSEGINRGSGGANKVLMIDTTTRKLYYTDMTGGGSGSGSGITSLGSGWGLNNVNDSTYEVDSTEVATQYDLSSGLAGKQDIFGNQSAWHIYGNHTSGSAAPTFGKLNVNSIDASGTPSSSTVLYGDGTWTTPPSSQWTTTGSDIYYNGSSGRVGIGTNTTINSLLNISDNTIAASPSNTSSIFLENPTPATSTTNLKVAPSILFGSKGWNSTSSSSVNSKFRIYHKPLHNTFNSPGNLMIQHSPDGTTFYNSLTIYGSSNTDASIQIGAGMTLTNNVISGVGAISTGGLSWTTGGLVNGSSFGASTGNNVNAYKMAISGSMSASGTGTLDEADIRITTNLNLNGGPSTWRGLYINPSITNLTNATAYSIQTTRGIVALNTSGESTVIGGTTPTADALLDLQTTTKALKLMNMTKAQRDAITTPSAGFMIYQTDNTPGLRVYNGTNWMRFTETAD